MANHSRPPARDRWAELVHTWRSYWKYPPDDAEIDLLESRITAADLGAAVMAMNHAVRTLDDRPSVRWLVRETAKRRPKPERTQAGCVDCRGEQWVNVAEPGEPPMFKPCPRCRPRQHQIWDEGFYATDAPHDHPRKTIIWEGGH